MNYEHFLEPSGGSSRGNWFMSQEGILTDLSLFGASWLHGKTLDAKRIGTTANFFSRNPYSIGQNVRPFRTPGILSEKLSAYNVVRTGASAATAGANPVRARRLRSAESAARRRWESLTKASNTQAILEGTRASDFGGGQYYKGVERYRKMGRAARTLGVAFLVEGLAELAMHIATPGISRVAARREQQLFADESPIDSGGAWTQRQRAINAIHDSQLTTRAVIGREASYFHR